MDDFYKLKKKNLAVQKRMLRDSLFKSFRFFADAIYNESSEHYEKGTRRVTSHLGYEEIVKLATRKNHFSFIHRREQIPFMMKFTEYIEVGTRGSRDEGDNEYFLFIYMQPKYLDYFVKRYGLVKY